jgi:hypothetical protein
MSSLWTPGGEHRVRPPGDGTADVPEQARRTPEREPTRRGDDGEELNAEEQAEVAQHLEELRRQMLDTPVEIVVANHVYGLFELAAIHLSQTPPVLDRARLAIDAMAALVEGLSGRLGDPEPSLRDALTQIRMAFVQISGPSAPDGESAEPRP